MKCAVHMHDPCSGAVSMRWIKLARVRVPLCVLHVAALDMRTAPFRWQTDEQLERWARDAAARATHG